MSFDMQDNVEVSATCCKDFEEAAHQIRYKDTHRFAHIHVLRSWFPAADPDRPYNSRWKAFCASRKSTLIGHLTISVIILTINLSWTTCMTTTFDTKKGMGTIYSGDCDVSKKLDLWLHLLINILSTTLLGSSNFCMQIIGAPSRHEIDKAHRNKKCLDFGSLSVRNLKAIARDKAMAWFLLGVSSASLSLFWNSAVYSSVPINRYRTAYVSLDFQTNLRSWNISDSGIAGLQARLQNFTYLDKQSCIATYIDPMATVGDVVVVLNRPDNSLTYNDGSSLIAGFYNPPSGPSWDDAPLWICSMLFTMPDAELYCHMNGMRPHISDWSVSTTGPAPDSPSTLVPVLYCLGAKVPSHADRCSFHFSIALMLVVCTLNAFMCTLVFYVLYRSKESTLVTLGDGIASFLEESDTHTARRCLLPTAELETKKWDEGPRTWQPLGRPRWFQAVGRQKLIFTYSLCSLALVCAITSFTQALSTESQEELRTDIASLWKQGLGEVHSYALVGGFLFLSHRTVSFFACVIFANLIQIICSFLYMLLTSLFMSLLVAKEWADLATERQPLRVSFPVGLQRPAYFFSLPLSYTIPLSASSSLLHWLISQSVFVVATAGWNSDGSRDYDLDAYRVGYSPIGIFFTIITGSIILLTIVLLGFRRLPSGSCASPLVRTCSAAISAACHPDPKDEDVHLLRVRWGVDRWDASRKVGHCCFSTAVDLAPPIPGHEYE